MIDKDSVTFGTLFCCFFFEGFPYLPIFQPVRQSGDSDRIIILGCAASVVALVTMHIITNLPKH